MEANLQLFTYKWPNIFTLFHSDEYS